MGTATGGNTASVSYVEGVDRRAKTMLWMALGCAALFGLLVLGAYFWGPGETLDNEGLAGFVNANHGWVRPIAWRLTDFGDPPTVAAITLALAALALVRGRPRVAVTVIGLVAATSVSSQVLKALLAHPRFPPIFDYPVGPDALPSGHATAAMSLALAGVLAAPRRARPFAALVGSVLALGVGAAVVGAGWHFPSDVIAGYLLATGWALGLTAGLHEADRRFPAREGWSGSAIARASDRIATGGLALLAAGAAAVAVLGTAALAFADPSSATCFAREHTAFVVVAGGVASSAVALPVMLAGVARRG
jgi:membrane-associated phospholipid phosphatase